MYKLMVVEDEKIIRRGIIQGVRWSELGFEVISEAKNGVEALEKLKEENVDVVITDIKMPIMDGIELSKRIREEYKDIEIVILSGFSEFDYAREAIRFNAYEYLLKPTKKTKLIEIFQKMKVKLDKQKENKKKSISNNVILNEGYENLRREFLLGVLDGDRQVLNDIKCNMDKLELDIDGEMFVSAVIDINITSVKERIEEAWKNDNKILTYVYKNIVDEVLKNIENSISVVRSINEIDVLFCFNDKKNQNEYIIEILDDINKKLKSIVFKNSDVKIGIGIGFAYSSILQASRSYKQAKKAIEETFFESDKFINVFNNAEFEFEQHWIKNYTKEVSHIVNTIVKGDKDDLEKLINIMFDKFIEYKINPKLIKDYCYILQFTLISNSYGLIDENEASKIQSEFDYVIKKSDSLKELREEIINLSINTSNVFIKLNNKEIENKEVIIKKAKDYIKANYSKKLTLDSISEEVYLSPNYFSVLFKKVTGETYIEYLQKVRMRAAKKMLEDRTKKVYEVAFAIGYSDYKYFVSKFKKAVGVSPKEYRQNIENQLIEIK
ncbi:response regulator [Paraclostridium ghonii]|uniref:Stage 0 sporulation protein A homolog n=1 Tax=Paraclostridium ghonii TaxID=29358 RepID=A0ABU0MZS7_9FIRM|nr:response regulator [Paeniclostridium ghonii]MDQ0556405.1 two-component system response regulator YesN [Paeniclostridium ghonii]